jgi:hypothetical protein
MTRLAFILFFMVSVTLMGIGVLTMLVTGNYTQEALLAAAAIGFVLAFPVTWFLARKLTELQ